MFVTGDTDLAAEINGVLERKTGQKHINFTKECDAWGFSTGPDDEWVIKSAVYSPDIVITPYKRDCGFPNRDFFSPRKDFDGKNINSAFRQLNAETAKKGYELYRLSCTKLIFRDLDGPWYSITLKYAVNNDYLESDGYVTYVPESCVIKRGEY